MKIEELNAFRDYRRIYPEIRTHWEDKKIAREKTEKQYSNFTGKCWVLGDAHMPYTKIDLVEEIVHGIRQDKSRDKLIILPGDTWTFDLFSSFRKELNYTVKATEELDRGKAFIKVLSNYADVLALKTNHEDRLVKFIQDRIQGLTEKEEINSFIKVFDFTIDGFTMVNSGYIQLGDVIVCHAEPASSVEGRTAQWAIQHFINSGVEFSALFTGHTHRVSKNIYWRKIGIEVGYLAKSFDYVKAFNVRYSKNSLPVKGYGTFEMEHGKVDLRSCDAHFLEFDEMA